MPTGKSTILINNTAHFLQRQIFLHVRAYSALPTVGNKNGNVQWKQMTSSQSVVAQAICVLTPINTSHMAAKITSEHAQKHI